MIAKIVGWIVAIVIIVWIVSDPAKAGTDVHNWVLDIVNFFTHLVSG